jgi:radical SAM superfamily enzyme YgiQ (UPF0313 family)
MIKGKIILFYPKTDKENSNMHMPLPALSIASDLLNSGYRVEIIDERKDFEYRKYLSEKLKDAILFGVSAMTGYQIKGGLEASRFVKAINRKIPVVWGGWHVSMLPEEALKNPYIDIGVIGPGEGALQQVCEKIIIGSSDFSGISGIVYKNNGEIINNIRTNNIDAMDSISRQAMGLLNVSDYIHQTELGSRSIFWVTSRGCPFNCGFCCSLKVYNRHWKGLSARKIIRDLEWLNGEYGINGINFVDTNFFVDKKRVLEMAQGIIEKKLNIQWAASVRVDQINLLDDKFLELLKKSGCIKLFIGAESGSREVLDLIDKNIKISDIFSMAGVLAKIGMIAEIYVMVGFPKDPLKDLNATLLLVKEIKKLYPNHQFTSFLYTPYPGTPLYNLAIKEGLKVPFCLEGWIDWNILEVRTPWIKTKGYSDRLHSFVKMYYPLAFPSDNLKRRFQDSKNGWIYWLLHKLESFRVRNDFFLFPIEWPVAKFANNLKAKYKILNEFSGFR